MTYSFRFELTLPPGERFGISAPSALLSPEELFPAVIITAVGDGKNIADVAEIAVNGDHYPTEEDARAAAEIVRRVLTLALCRLGRGADFGDRKLGGTIFVNRYLADLAARIGRPVMNRPRGTITYPTGATPLFLGGKVEGVASVGERPLLGAVDVAYGVPVAPLTDSQRLAFDLFSGSAFERSPDARLMMLMMSVETLIEPQPRRAGAQLHVRRLIANTRSTTALTPNEKEALSNITRLMLKESITQAGCRLAARLGARRYMEMSAERFFKHAYSLRSALAHGRVPRPSPADVGNTIGPLRQFVGDLLADHIVRGSEATPAPAWDLPRPTVRSMPELLRKRR